MKKEDILLKLKLDGTSAKTFRQWVRALKVIAPRDNDILFSNTEKGIKVRTMNPERVGMVDSLFQKEFFDTWSATPLFFGLNWQETKDILEFLKLKNGLEIIITPMLVYFKTKTSTLTIPRLDLGEATYPPPKIAFSVKCGIDSVVFWDLIRRIKRLKKFDFLHFIADKKKSLVSIKSSSHTMGLEEKLEAYSFEVKEDAEARYSLNYLMDIKDAIKLGEITHINMSANMPVMLEWNLTKESHFRYYLAPRVET